MAKQDEISGALFTFKALQRSGKQLDEGTLTLLLDAAARTARADLALEVCDSLCVSVSIACCSRYW